jgi:S-adenosylmethionine hydrolase
MRRPVITFLSDYGLDDDFVGVCHGVITTICPEAVVIDISHGIRRHDVRAGALILAGALPYMPAGVHLAVVDPGVGAHRRAVAVSTADERIMVGPDNGLLSLAADAAGGVVDAIDVGTSPFRLDPVSATFHGRDVFAPVAARIASGVSLREAGTPFDPEALIRLELPRPQHIDGTLVAHVLYIDTFGNVQLDAGHTDLAESRLKLGREVILTLTSGETHEARYARTFAEVEPGTLLVYEDSYRRLALAISHGSAAGRLGIAPGDELRISPK